MPLIITLSAIYFPLNDPLITGIVTVISSLIKVVFNEEVTMNPEDEWKDDVTDSAYEIGWEDGYWNEGENPFDPDSVESDDYNLGRHDARNP